MQINQPNSNRSLTSLKETYLVVCNTDDEKKFVEAFTGSQKLKQIEDDNEKKLMIVDIITFWMEAVGIRTVLSKTSLSFIASFISENYGEITPDEIKLAINLSLTGKLDVDANPYGSFSVIYVGNILNAYNDYRLRLSTQLAMKKAEHEEKELKDQSNYQPTPEEKLENLKFWILECHKNIQENNLIVDFADSVWRFLYSRKKLITVDEATKDEANAYAERRLRMETKDGRISSLLIQTNMQKRFAKEFLIRRFFDGIDVEKFVNDLTLEDIN